MRAGGPTKVEILKDLGLRGAVVGANAVCKKKDGTKYTITAVNQTVVKLSLGADVSTVKVSELFDKYSVKRKVVED